MKIIIQKFGGTSLKDDVGKRLATRHIAAAVSREYKIVVVVSAMGRSGDPYATDSLLALLAHSDETKIAKRELDLLLSCGEIISAVIMSHWLKQADIKAVMLTGAQAGIRTTSDYGKARITAINEQRLLSELEDHHVVVVPGFQGVSETGEVTTLGRGGSDTTAAALGAVLQAEWIDLFTDVEGMMTADPSIVAKARPLPVVTYHEVSNMANQGAKVVHPRAVEIARQANVPIRIRSTYANTKGTLITSEKNRGQKINDRLITGIVYVDNITQIKVLEKDEYSHLQSKVFKAMAEHGISVDFININPKAVVYTVASDMTEKALGILKQMGYEPIVERQCAKVSAVGAGMAGVPGVTAKIVSALMEVGIQILQSADSHTTIWVLIKQKDLELAVNALHNTFALDRNDMPPLKNDY